MAIEALAWLGEWLTVPIAGQIATRVHKELKPNQVEQVLKKAIAAANQKAEQLFHACPPDGRKGVQRFLGQFFQTLEVVGELQKPWQEQGKPDVGVFVAAFVREAKQHPTMYKYKPEYLQPWMAGLVESYFDQIKGICFEVARLRYLQALIISCDDIKFVGIDTAVRERERSAQLLDIFVVSNVVAEPKATPCILGEWQTDTPKVAKTVS
jgi:hypothetical protein